MASRRGAAGERPRPAVPDRPPQHVTLVVGPEELLADRAVGQVVTAVRRHRPDAQVDVHRLSAVGLDAGVLVELASPSLFGEDKVIVVADVQDAAGLLLDALRDFVTDVPDDVFVVLVHKGTQAGKRVLTAAREAGADEISCPKLAKRGERVDFLRGEFGRHRRPTTPEALDGLLEAVGDDLRALAAACDQLASDTEGTIDAEVVGRYFAGRAEVKGFAVADRAVEGRPDEALVELRWALHTGTDPVPVVAALAAAVRNVIRVASAGPAARAADLARELGLPPWKVDVVRRQARGWTGEGAAAALLAVAEADAQVKGAGADPAYALEKAVVAVATARGATR